MAKGKDKKEFLVLTPQQHCFLNAYLDPKSPTWSNATQSALTAGYSAEYADNIMALMPDWLSGSIGKSKLVNKALKNLDMALDGLLDDPEKGGKPIQYKATETTLRTLKKEDFSERVENTGKDGKDLIPETLTKEEKEALKKLIK